MIKLRELKNPLRLNLKLRRVVKSFLSLQLQIVIRVVRKKKKLQIV